MRYEKRPESGRGKALEAERLEHGREVAVLPQLQALREELRFEYLTVGVG